MLTDQVLLDLSSNARRKIITLITIEVHARDVVTKLISDRVESYTCFQWSSQLKYTLNENTLLAQIQICDYECTYGYEYIGNCGCLVITPLTDRCYITLTQAQRLILGGAPAGPAGTGKTETVKDLGRALGIIVYVFNCSDQMDYKGMGAIYKGLAQAGAWGCATHMHTCTHACMHHAHMRGARCFDEFNRIPVEVLSVCSTQWKCVLEAIRAKKKRFVFEDIEIHLEWKPVCGTQIPTHTSPHVRARPPVPARPRARAHAQSSTYGITGQELL